MITETIPEYLEIWPRVFPYMVTLGVQMTILVSMVMSLYLLFTWFTPSRIFQQRLNQGIPVFLNTFKGWLRQHFIVVLYLVWGAFLLTPILGFIPIVVFNIRNSLILEALGLIVLTILYKWKLHKYHKKIAHTKYYFKNQSVGLRFFGNDIIIPFQAIIDGIKDDLIHKAALRFQVQVPLSRSKRERTYYFQFSTRESYDAFIEAFNEIKAFEWKEETLASTKDSLFTTDKETLSYESTQFLNKTSLEKELPERTLKILTSIDTSSTT